VKKVQEQFEQKLTRSEIQKLGKFVKVLGQARVTRLVGALALHRSLSRAELIKLGISPSMYYRDRVQLLNLGIKIK
jgi:hypothetical protein